MRVSYYKYLNLAALLLPPLIMLFLVVHYAVNVPVTDQYALIPTFQSMDHGHIPWSVFWQQHNEHRIFFPTLFQVFFARLTHWNILAEVYVSFITAVAGFIALIQILWRRIGAPDLRIGITFLAGLFYFSPVQWENWLWGWQFEWFLCVACILWGINLVDKFNKSTGTRKLVGLLPFGIVATFSLGSGFLVWVMSAIIMLVRRVKRSTLTALIGTMLLSLAIYYFHYHKPANGLSSTSFLSNLPAYFKYYLAYIGRPISDDTRVAVIAGMYIAIAFVIAVGLLAYKKKIQQFMAYIAVGLLGLIAGTMTVAARFDYGIAGALSSRYTAFSNLIIISTIALYLGLISLQRRSLHNTAILSTALLLIALPAVAYSWLGGMNGVRTRSQLYHYIYTCSRQTKPDQACLYQIYFPDTKIADDCLQYLKAKGYGGYTKGTNTRIVPQCMAQ